MIGCGESLSEMLTGEERYDRELIDCVVAILPFCNPGDRFPLKRPRVSLAPTTTLGRCPETDRPLRPRQRESSAGWVVVGALLGSLIGWGIFQEPAEVQYSYRTGKCVKVLHSSGHSCSNLPHNFDKVWIQ